MTRSLGIGSNLVSLLALVLVNLLPLIGVLWWGWSLMLILVLYWLESGIVGVLNVFKIARAEGPMLGPSGDATPTPGRITIRMTGLGSAVGKGALIGFFVMHYGIFWMVHGTFVFLMPVFAGISRLRPEGGPSMGGGPIDFGGLPLDGLVLSAALLAASHTVSFFTNYLGRGEYRRVTPQGQMFSVYGRVVVLHVTIVAGAFVIGFFGTPIAALVLLVGLKTLIDVVLHLREHRPGAPSGGLSAR